MKTSPLAQRRSLEEAGALLMHIGVLTPRWFADGGRLQATRDADAAVLAMCPSGGGYVLKRAPEGEAGMMRLRQEALALATLDEHGPAGLASRLLRFEPDRRLSVMALIEGRDLFAFHHNEWEPSIPMAELVADRLAELHAMPLVFGPDVAPIAAGPTPWILDACEDAFVTRMQPISSAAAAVVDAIRSEARFGPALHAARDGWRPTAVIHGDLKWTNIVVRRDGSVALIDWENAGIGDPAWDLGSYLHSYLEFWLLSLPLDVEPDFVKAAASGGWSQSSMRAAMRAFWRRYTSRPGMLTEPGQVIRSAGARLAQTAFERAQPSDALDAYAPAMLRLSLNLLERPEKAAAMLGVE